MLTTGWTDILQLAFRRITRDCTLQLHISVVRGNRYTDHNPPSSLESGLPSAPLGITPSHLTFPSRALPSRIAFTGLGHADAKPLGYCRGSRPLPLLLSCLLRRVLISESRKGGQRETQDNVVQPDLEITRTPLHDRVIKRFAGPHCMT